MIINKFLNYYNIYLRWKAKTIQSLRQEVQVLESRIQRLTLMSQEDENISRAAQKSLERIKKSIIRTVSAAPSQVPQPETAVPVTQTSRCMTRFRTALSGAAIIGGVAIGVGGALLAGSALVVGGTACLASKYFSASTPAPETSPASGGETTTLAPIERSESSLSRSTPQEQAEVSTSIPASSAVVSTVAIPADSVVEQNKKKLLAFFEPVVQGQTHHKKFIEEQFELPSDAEVILRDDKLIINLPSGPVKGKVDFSSMTPAEFEYWNRHTEQQELRDIGKDSFPSAPVARPDVKNLQYFRAFGPKATARLKQGQELAFGPRIVLKRERNAIIFEEGGPGIKKVEFLEGYEKEGGVVKIFVPICGISTSDKIFLKDIALLKRKIV